MRAALRRRSVLVTCGLLTWIGASAVCTFLVLTDALAAADPSSAEGASLWARYIRDWTFWNHVRLIASIGASVLFIIGLTSE